MRICRSWVVMDGLRSSLMAENVAGRYPMDVLNGVCAPLRPQLCNIRMSSLSAVLIYIASDVRQWSRGG